ncbi:tyrosine-type recombinase/integrase, partial [Burkholderia gladioli]|uniref:tyrosine-type recombinase/integrase n=1 Tax=Burkholderia gladioli TaxID=28095 RepID=UPI003C7AD861
TSSRACPRTGPATLQRYCRIAGSLNRQSPNFARQDGMAGRLQLNDVLVFPSPREKVLSDMALTALLRRVKAESDTPGRFATAHGFRSSFRDWASEHGYARDLAERALAHTVANKVEAAYHRTDLLEQRRPLMEAWAKHVSSN